MVFDENQINNLLSGLFGAIIAVFLTSLLERFKKAKQLNRIRITILDYIKNIGLDKSRQYEKDMSLIKKLITNEEKEKVQNTRNLDAMPMFTSDIFKGFSFDDLRKSCFSSINYIKILEISYGIDFLKSNMPLDIYNRYQRKIFEHYEEKGLKTSREQLLHLKECEMVKQLTLSASNEAEAKLQTVKALNEHIIDFIKNMKGPSFCWINKYFWR